MNTNNNTNNNVYTRCKILVVDTVPGVMSHILNCHCKTINHPNEKTLILKKVNFYKFKTYVEATFKTNWQDWYFANSHKPELKQALADFINHTEQRTQIYCQNINLSESLDSLIAKAKQLKADTQQWLATH